MVEIYTDVSLAKGRGVATCFVMSSTSYIGYNMFEYTALNSSLQGELLGIRDGIKYVASLNTTNEPVTLYCDNKAAIGLINSKLAKYIKFILDSPFTYNFIDYVKVGGGTHTYKINIEDMSRFPIPLAPINEQERIINKVNILFNTIN